MYRNKLRNAYINWSKSCDYNVFGTLNFAVGQKVSLHQAEIAWRVFWNKVDRLLRGDNYDGRLSGNYDGR